VLTQFGGGDWAIMFRYTAITRGASGGSITFQIGSNPPPSPRNPKAMWSHNLLVVPLANQPRPVMAAVLYELASSHQLQIVAP
jgi:hypothetical protein